MGHDRETLRSVHYHCRNGNIGAALVRLKEAASRAHDNKAQDIKRVIRYINANASGLKDYRENTGQQDSMLRRTGAIEGNIDKVIVRRMKNQGMSWSIQGIRRMVWLRINMRQGTLTECLRSHVSETASVAMPKKQVNRVIDRTMNYTYVNYFNAGLPALSGPHASRPWVEMLKSLTRIEL